MKREEEKQNKNNQNNIHSEIDLTSVMIAHSAVNYWMKVVKRIL